MRIWFREVKGNRMIRDYVVENNRADTRTHKIFDAVDEAALELDLSRPIWLDANVEEFKRRAKTRFDKDNFIDDVPFDYLEISVIEED